MTASSFAVIFSSSSRWVRTLRVLAVEVLGRGVHVDADRDDRCAVLDDRLPPVGLDGRHEVADIAGRLGDLQRYGRRGSGGACISLI